MSFAHFLSHLGSLFLGVTLAFAILLSAASRHTQPDGADACLVSLFTCFGLCLAMLCYLAAVGLIS
jgi:hypothetical protein